MNTTSSRLTYNLVQGTYLTLGDHIPHDPLTVLSHLKSNAIKLKSIIVLSIQLILMLKEQIME